MLEIHGKIHDRYTLEFKVGYSRYSPSAAVSDFMMDTWIFIPDSLYINAKTYPKSNFYRDFLGFGAPDYAGLYVRGGGRRRSPAFVAVADVLSRIGGGAFGRA